MSLTFEGNSFSLFKNPNVIHNQVEVVFKWCWFVSSGQNSFHLIFSFEDKKNLYFDFWRNFDIWKLTYFICFNIRPWSLRSWKQYEMQSFVIATACALDEWETECFAISHPPWKSAKKLIIVYLNFTITVWIVQYDI